MSDEAEAAQTGHSELVERLRARADSTISVVVDGDGGIHYGQLSGETPTLLREAAAALTAQDAARAFSENLLRARSDALAAADEEIAKAEAEITRLQREWSADIDALQAEIARLREANRVSDVAFAAKNAEIARLVGALRYARPLVEKWCHTQGDNPEFFRATLAPIDAALGAQP